MNETWADVCTNDFHIVTYFDVSMVADSLACHTSLIEYAFYILHDRDDNEPHIHIWLKLKRARKAGEIVRWFSDSDHNARIEKNHYKRSDAIDYALHRSLAAVADGKARYDRSQVSCFQTDIDTLEANLDRAFLCLQDMLSGVSVLDLARKYGSDFIYHFRSFREVAVAVQEDTFNSSLQVAVSYKVDGLDVTECANPPFAKYSS